MFNSVTFLFSFVHACSIQLVLYLLMFLSFMLYSVTFYSLFLSFMFNAVNILFCFFHLCLLCLIILCFFVNLELLVCLTQSIHDNSNYITWYSFITAHTYI